MGGGQSSANIQQAGEIVRLKLQLESAETRVAELEKANPGAKPSGEASRKTMAIQGRASTTENRFARPNQKGVRRGMEVSAEAKKKGAAYEKAVVPKADGVKAVLRANVDSSILFAKLHDQEKEDAVDAFYAVEAKAGEVIMNQGDAGHNYYIVESGSLSISVTHGGAAQKYGDVTEGMSVGELALLYNTPRAATVLASTDVKLWALDRATYRSICQHYRHERGQKYMRFLKQVDNLKNLSDRELTQLAEAMEEEVYDKGDVIVRQGEKGDYFYIIVSGEIVVDKDGTKVADLKAGEYFGDRALLTEETRAATCSASSAVTLLSINRDHFVELLGTLSDLIARTSVAEENVPFDLQTEAKKHKYGLKIQMADLEIKATLGCGAFGRVKLVKHKETAETYALKCMVKTEIVANNLEDHVVNEKNVMLALDHPFILKLHCTYKDDTYIYLLLELAIGGEIFTFLRKAGRFNEKASRFYASAVTLAFKEMHERQIAYRDLKPENLLLDERGFLKVVDFGLAKVVTDRTWTLCGTPDYLAPEIILSKGHDYAVDCWALGVLIYEMSAGFVPFYSDDPMEVYQLILACDLKFPSHFSRAAMDLVTKLMCQNQTKRLGNMKNGVKDIIKHKWFSGYDWDGLMAGTLDPPIKPKVKSKEDMSNFDEYPDDETKVAPCPSWDPDF